MLETLHVSDRTSTGVSYRRAVADSSPVAQFLLASSVVLGTTLIALLVEKWIGHRALALCYLLVVVLLALFVGRGPVLLAAALSAGLWEFFLVPPMSSFHIREPEDAIMVVIYFVVALVLGQLTARIRAQERLERQREERATALYLMARELIEATTLDDWARQVVEHLETVFCARTAILLPAPGQRYGYQIHPAGTHELTGPEQPVAQIAFEKAQPAGKFTQSCGEADSLFVPLTAGQQVLAVLGLSFTPSSRLSPQQRDLLEAFLQQIALALDRHRLREEAAKTRLLGESERLSKTLLNSMSHEIRTPLAAIQTAVTQLAEDPDHALAAEQQLMVGEIQEATRRLNSLVGKVLDTTRLEAGSVKPKLTLCDVADLVHVAIKETRKELAQHRLSVEVAPGLPLIRADYVLLQQALMNLLSNAALHTPSGTAIELSARARNGSVVLSVADRGPGIAAEAMPRLFDKFYRGPAAPTGGTGLGLSLVKGFVEAQGGEVKAENRLGGGAAFAIVLPLH